MFNCFINDIIDNCTKYLPVAFVIGLIFIAFYILFLYKEWFYDPKRSRVSLVSIKKSGLKRVILFYIFFIYCFMIAAVALMSREPGSREGINLQVFRMFSKNLLERTYSFENIVMFLPLGFLLPMMWRKFDSVLYCLLAGFFCSASIELIQFITKRGYSELDDILCNTIGAVIGYLIFLGIRVIFRYRYRLH